MYRPLAAGSSGGGGNGQAKRSWRIFSKSNKINNLEYVVIFYLTHRP
jgi:hypothetical protein